MQSGREVEMDDLFSVGPAPEDVLRIYDDGFSDNFARLSGGVEWLGMR